MKKKSQEQDNAVMQPVKEGKKNYLDRVMRGYKKKVCRMFLMLEKLWGLS